MKKFRYKARTKEGVLMTGVVEAVDERQAVALLRERGLVVVHLGSNEDITEALKSLVWKVSTSNLANFTRQLATMIGAGLNLVEALVILENQSEGKLKSVVGEVRRGVESGQALSKAMEGQKSVFDKVYISLIQAGETAGVLDQVMLRLADNLEKKREFESKVKGALLYPAIILVGMVVVMMVMVLFVIPQLADLYEEFEADLPWMTSALIAFSRFATQFWWLGIGVGVGLVVGWRFLNSRPTSRQYLEVILLSTPVLGQLWEEILLTDLTRTLAMLTSAGVPIVEALLLTSRGMSSRIYEDGIVQAAKLVEKGFPIAQAFSQQSHFPPILSQMLTVGEETGQVDKIMAKISQFFQSESEQKVKGLTTAIEPLILILLGGGVAFLVFAVVMPIYNLTSTL